MIERQTRGLLGAAPYVIALALKLTVDATWPLIGMPMDVLAGATVLLVALASFLILHSIPFGSLEFPFGLFGTFEKVVVPFSETLASLHATGVVLLRCLHGYGLETAAIA